jgi:hypothetical protein
MMVEQEKVRLLGYDAVLLVPTEIRRSELPPSNALKIKVLGCSETLQNLPQHKELYSGKQCSFFSPFSPSCTTQRQNVIYCIFHYI